MVRVEARLTAPLSEEDFAGVELVASGGERLCKVEVGFSALRKLESVPSEEVLDLFLVSQMVYALDRLVPRREASDNWARRFSLVAPVSEPAKWESVRVDLEGCLGFLTNDFWEVEFASREVDLVGPTAGARSMGVYQTGSVSLFSGGLDSLIGVIDRLEGNPEEGMLLVGHHDPRMAGPLSDQKAVWDYLERHYPGRTRTLLVAAGPDSGKDTTLRGRSFSFVALGLFAANATAPDVPLLIPENGTIALNVPLTPSRSGSLSTRTTHPHYLGRLRMVLEGLGIANHLVNPLEMKTKGECAAECLNPEALRDAVPASASCAKRGHRSTWLRRTAKQCGRCMPCIYRRAALHAIGLDDETYGRDVCAGEVPLDSNYAYADDFRACISFLRNGYSKDEIAALLLENGRLDISRLCDYAGTVGRAIEEIRDLLRDKAVDQVKHGAGLLFP